MNEITGDRADWALAVGGDGRAFGRVFDRHAHRLRRHVTGLVPGPSDADDVVGVVFLEAWRNRDRVRFVDDSLLPWLLVTATNTAHNAARGARRYRRLLGRFPVDDPAPDPAEHFTDGEAVSALHGALVGRPAFSEGQGDLRVPLGPPPAGGGRVTFSWTCLTAGTVSVRIDDQVVWEPTACEPDRPGATTTTAPSWTMVAPPGTGREAVTLALTTGSARVAVWASWATAPRIAEPSAQQAVETADGVVTLDEYTAAFNRLQACSAQAGTPMGVVPLTWLSDGLWTRRPAPGATGPWYLYSTPSSGSEAFDTQCSPREFTDVDGIWQTEHPMPEDPPVQPLGG